MTIKEIRKIKKWTQKEMANNLDVSLRAVVYWEAGTKKPDRRSEKALKKLGYTSEEIS